MKRLYKALALSLLLALVLSAFGMFSTFAQESGGGYINVVYDMNEEPGKTINNVGGKYPAVPTMTVDKIGERPVWEFDYVNTPAGPNPNTAGWVNVFNGRNDIRYQDSSTNGSKNVDYIVIDLDVSTDTDYIDELYFNLRYNTPADKTAGTSATRAATSLMVMKGADGRLCVANSDGTNVVPSSIDLNNKWTNVTVVYDITSNASETPYKHDLGAGYVYIDGFYCGNINGVLAAGAEIDFVRLTPDGAELTSDNASSKVANLTFKTFEVGYSGFMTEEGVLGNSAMKLSDIPELAYCLEDLPEEGKKVADIVRGGETVPVYSTDELATCLMNGDTVKLYLKLTEKLFVNEGDTVTVLDMAGNDITASCVNSIPAGTKWIAVSGSDVTYGSDNSIYSAISDSAKNKLILLDDTVAASNGTKTAAKGVRVDLNGHKLTVDASAGAFVSAAEGSSLLIENGSLELIGGSLVSASAQNNVAILRNVEATLSAGTLVSQAAGGLVEYSNCTVTGEGGLLRSAASAASILNITLDNSTVRVSGASPIAISGASVGNTTAFLNVNDSFIGTDAADTAVITTDMPTLAAASAFAFELNAELTDVTLSGAYALAQLSSGYADGTEYGDGYLYEANITLTDATLITSNADKALVDKTAKLAKAALDVDVYGELTVPTTDIARYVKYGAGAPTANDSFELLTDGQWVLRSGEGIAGYYSHTLESLDSHSYIINGHEYEFYAYVGDEVNENNIPEKLPAESTLLSYRWEYNIDGAYEAIITYKGDIKANVTASDSLALNVYLPDDFGDDAYNYVYANGNRASVYDVTHDGESYKAITIPGIDPLSATKDFKIKFRVVDENGTVADVVCNVSVLDYIESALKSDTLGTEEKQLVASLLNYIAKAEKYGSINGENSAAVKALLDSAEYGAIVLPTPAAGAAKTSIGSLGVFSGLRLSLDTNVTYELAVKEGFAGQITVSYVKGGVTVTETLDVEAGDVVKVSMLAYELDTTVTVSYAGNSGEINLAGYMSLVPDSAKGDNFAALAEAIAIYAAAADAFKN